jgi:hypothetical protein
MAALAGASPVFAIEGFESDRFDTGSGELEIIFISHATLAFQYEGKTIHVDRWATTPTTRSGRRRA